MVLGKSLENIDFQNIEKSKTTTDLLIAPKKIALYLHNFHTFPINDHTALIFSAGESYF